VEEIASAGAGDARARASLLSFLPPLLRDYREKVLDVDGGAAAVSLLEKLVHALRGVDPAHPAVKETIAVVSKRLQEARAAAAAATT
jgi:hypothetical protein